MGFPMQKYWSELPFLFPGSFSDPGMESTSPAWQVDFSPLSHQESNKRINNIKMKLTIQFILASKKDKTLKNKFNEGSTKLIFWKLQKKKLKESNEDLNKYKDTPCSRTGIPLTWLYAPNWPTDSIHLYQNLSQLLCGNWQADLRIHKEL